MNQEERLKDIERQVNDLITSKIHLEDIPMEQRPGHRIEAFRIDIEKGDASMQYVKPLKQMAERLTSYYHSREGRGDN